jgi:hypothetical protein
MPRSISLRQSLQERRKGRYQQLRDTVSRNELSEPGLVETLALSLGDGDKNLARYVAESVLPIVGPSAVPFLKRDFNPDGNGTDALRLIALRGIDLAEARILARAALQVTHKRLRAEAFATLSGSSDDAELLLSFTRSRSSESRTCAFKALSGVRKESVIDSVCRDFQKGVREAKWAMRDTSDEAYAETIATVLELIRQNRNGGFALTEAEARRLLDCVRACWGQENHRPLDEAVFAWLCFAFAGGFDHPGTEDPVGNFFASNSLFEAVAASHLRKSQEYLVANRSQLKCWQRVYAMTAAALIFPNQLFDLFGEWESEGANSWGGLDMQHTWPASISDAIRIAAVTADGECYRSWQPRPFQRVLLELIRKDPRWTISDS